jgi:hypothetical protein
VRAAPTTITARNCCGHVCNVFSAMDIHLKVPVLSIMSGYMGALQPTMQCYIAPHRLLSIAPHSAT